MLRNRIAWIAGLLLAASPLHADLELARDGATNYVIVTAADATAVDRYAAKQLAFYLRPMTGADFPVIAADRHETDGRRSPTGGAAGGVAAEPGTQGPVPKGDDRQATAQTDSPAIFIGLSVPALQRLGEADPLAGLADDEHIWRSHGRDIFLYGNGLHGNLHAVMAFLEDQLGWRWFSRFEYPLVPAHPVLQLEPFRRQRGFSFAFRAVDIQRGSDFPYQHGINMGFDHRIELRASREGQPAPPRAERDFLSKLNDVGKSAHSLFSFVPPNPAAHGADRWPWLEKKDYFETNPDYFSLWETGQRVSNRQLCFSNPGLRSELTRNVLTAIDKIGEPCLITLAAQDTPNRFCYCEGCTALERKHGSIGGPFYDYLFEICGLLAKRHPGVLIHTLAYRRAQTQKPPILPEGQRLPANLVIDFAPIEDNYFADWDHPDARIQETYADLQAWSRITHPGRLSAWLYPNGWGTGIGMPVGNVRRAVTNMRKMHATGVRWVFLDHVIHQRPLFSELRSYLILKLMQDIEADTDAIVREFTDYMYGPAAGLFGRFLDELEAGRLAMTQLPPGVTYHSHHCDDRTFPYLTPENIHRWQGYFDEMMQLTAAGAEVRWRTNVMLARRELDAATLWKWFALAEMHPGAYTDHQRILDRIAAANATEPPPAPEWETRAMNRRWSTHPHECRASDFAVLIQAGGKRKPLPPPLDGLPADAVRQYAADYSSYARGRNRILDPDAAFGYAVPVHRPDLPFEFGFYQNDTKTHGARKAVPRTAIRPGEYQLFKLGTVTLTPDCILWFSARSWATQVPLGDRLYEPGSENRWEAWVSVKFLGPTYGSVAGEALLPPAARAAYEGLHATDLVLVDRVILVK